MGVIWTALAVVGALVGAALLAAVLESAFNRLGAVGHEAGPAAPVEMEAVRDLPMADRWLNPAGPLLALLGAAFAMVVVPFGPNLIGADLEIGVFYFIVVVDFIVLGLAAGGWGANTAGAVEVYYRVVAQLVAYVVPLGLAYIGAIMMARSLSTIRIVEAQAGLWYIVPQPLGFALYIATGLMQCYRAPFLEPFSSLIDHGVLGVHGGWKAVVWRITLAGLLFLVAAMGAVLFLGGWQGPVLPGPVWMLIKTCALMVFMLWAGRRMRLLSSSQMLALSWKVLTPVGLANVLIVGIEILLGVGGGR